MLESKFSVSLSTPVNFTLTHKMTGEIIEKTSYTRERYWKFGLRK